MDDEDSRQGSAIKFGRKLLKRDAEFIIMCSESEDEDNQYILEGTHIKSSSKYGGRILSQFSEVVISH